MARTELPAGALVTNMVQDTFLASGLAIGGLPVGVRHVCIRHVDCEPTLGCVTLSLSVMTLLASDPGYRSPHGRTLFTAPLPQPHMTLTNPSAPAQVLSCGRQIRPLIKSSIEILRPVSFTKPSNRPRGPTPFGRVSRSAVGSHFLLCFRPGTGSHP